MYGVELVCGFGPEMELVTHAEGTEIMHKSGYDAAVLLSVISALINPDRYHKAATKNVDKPQTPITALCASHKHNDFRIQTCCKTANMLDLNPMEDDPELSGYFSRKTEDI